MSPEKKIKWHVLCNEGLIKISFLKAKFDESARQADEIQRHVYTSLSVETEILHTSVSSTGVIVIVLQFLSLVQGHMMIFTKKKNRLVITNLQQGTFTLKQH